VPTEVVPEPRGLAEPEVPLTLKRNAGAGRVHGNGRQLAGLLLDQQRHRRADRTDQCGCRFRHPKRGRQDGHIVPNVELGHGRSRQTRRVHQVGTNLENGRLSHAPSLPDRAQAPRYSRPRDGTNERVKTRLPFVALLLGVLSTVCLVLPWVRVGSRDRSSIDLIGSAGALDIIEGATKAIVVLLWFLLPVLVAAAMLSLAAGRIRLLGWLLLPLGLILGAIVLLLLIVAGDVVVWGAWLSAAFAVGASASAIMVLVGQREGTR